MRLGCKIILVLFIFIIIGLIVYFVEHSSTSDDVSPSGIDQGSRGIDQDGGQDTDTDTSKLAYTVTVSQSGNGDFTTIQDAVNSIHTKSRKHKQWIRILVQPGVYNEQVQIPQDKSCILLQGHGPRHTTITYNAHDETDTSPTVKILADNVVVKGITFENSYITKIKGQNVQIFSPAVATMVSGDKIAFYKCAFKGYQDTLWDQQGRHYFKNCHIEGAVDFIWGNGQSFYEGCSINAIDGGFITAQGRASPNDPSGYVFNNCKVNGDAQTYLGRAYGPNSRVIFVNSMLDRVVQPQGWNIWRQQGHEGDIVYAEVNCNGPGANSPLRVPWRKNLNGVDMAQYTLTSFVDQDGWISKQP
ncbi:hypothetical protein RND81_04G226200 [Saponaria officinalis]|uniref:pectinesterase n=1 Tax=Saponaria officinalis TaxID=3572 RepID=A0AAW1LP34_SAPOF